jgi:hypothetical protein
VISRDAYDSTPPRGSQPEYARVYRSRGQYAHLRHEGDIACDPLGIRFPPGDDDRWLGTGSQAEYETAARRPLCPRCFAWREANLAGGRA